MNKFLVSVGSLPKQIWNDYVVIFVSCCALAGIVLLGGCATA